MNKVKIRVDDNSYKLINYLINNNIYYESLLFMNNYYILDVCFNDYKKISRRYNTIIIKYYGSVGLKHYFLVNKYMFISFIISMFILYLLSNTIFDIKINSDDKNIIKILNNELKNNGIYKYKKKKDFEELQLIKNKILENNKNYLEWIEIKSKGCIYIIEVTPRIINNEEKEKLDKSSIYASNDGVIKYISVENGTRIVDINDYVHKGDLLISGNVFKDEKIIYSTNAKGKVYAEVWYLVKASIPFNYSKYEPTNKIINHYYLEIFSKKFTIMGKYDSSYVKSKTYTIINKPYLFFKLYKEVKTEYKNIEYSIDEKDAYNKALEEATNKIKSTLKSDEYIIGKKVLKKDVNSSKMVIEVFFKIYKDISHTSNIEIVGEIDGKSNKRGN